MGTLVEIARAEWARQRHLRCVAMLATGGNPVAAERFLFTRWRVHRGGQAPALRVVPTIPVEATPCQ